MDYPCYHVDGEGRYPLKEKVAVITEAPSPKNVALPGQTSALLPRLITDDIWIAAVPSIHAVDNDVHNKQATSKRHRRRVSI